MTRRRPFFILTVARSGSTSLARILDTASNGHCAVEPAPNLNVEMRLAMDGLLADPRTVVQDLVVPRVTAGLREHGIYGEKNLTYGPFIEALHELLEARFIFVHRDGREVVRSMMDWHNLVFGSIYRECRDPGTLTPRARAAAARLPVHLDTSDYARPRPRPDDPLHAEWEGLSREAMCAWYWSTVNMLYASGLSHLPGDAWTEIDSTRMSVDEVRRVAAFVGLLGLDRARVESMLAARINSVEDRGGGGEGDVAPYPAWPGWSEAIKRDFERHAGSAMRSFGYSERPGALVEVAGGNTVEEGARV